MANRQLASRHTHTHVSELVANENKELKERLETLEKQNRDLKKSVYELSVSYGVLLGQTRKADARPEPFNVDSLLNELPAGVLKELNNDSAVVGTETGKSGASRGAAGYRDGRLLSFKHALSGHTSANYSVRWSSCGTMITTGSIDSTVRVWDAMTQHELTTLNGHIAGVSDVTWCSTGNESSHPASGSLQSTRIISGSYDASAKMWDIVSSNTVHSFDADGFVQAVTSNPVAPTQYFCATSRGKIHVVDSRSAASTTTFDNASNGMVNSLYIYRDGTLVLAADAAGRLSTWDVRMAEIVDVTDVSSGVPLSHVTVSSRCGYGAGAASSTGEEEEEQRYLAVNSYDNVLRVYDRGSLPPKTPLRLLQACKGHKNTHWPIRSSFFHGENYRPPDKKTTTEYERVNSADDDDDDDVRKREKDINSSLLVATGSADAGVYIYDVGGAGGTWELVQRLEGHGNRAYAVDFHPSEPLLASCSVDGTIRVWGAKAKRHTARQPTDHMNHSAQKRQNNYDN